MERFTGHQHLDAVGLIHMNGRICDPVIGRFVSANPLVQAPFSSQSYNRYNYVMNNPLSFVDPTGLECAPFVDAVDVVVDQGDEVKAKKASMRSGTASCAQNGLLSIDERNYTNSDTITLTSILLPGTP